MMTIDLAISADEIGIRSARQGEMVLRSAYQLVYRVSGDAFEAVSAEGFLRIFRSGQVCEPGPYLDGLPEQDRIFAMRLATALHIANHVHIGIDGLDHLLAVRQDEAMLSCQALSCLLGETGLDPERVTCLLREPSCLRAEAVGELRRLGARIAMASGGQPDLHAIRTVQPDIVSIDGDWFRRVCRSASAMRLLCRFVGGLRSEGIAVIVDGIETRAQLRAAVDTGADMLRGYLFGRPQLAGTVPPEAVLDRTRLLSGGGEVVPLFDAGLRRGSGGG